MKSDHKNIAPLTFAVLVTLPASVTGGTFFELLYKRHPIPPNESISLRHPKAENESISLRHPQTSSEP